MKNSPKKKSVAQLKKIADAEWSKYIRLRDSDQYGYGNCITCGVKKFWKEAQCGHFISRKISLLRYDELNTSLQCVGCNMFKSGEQYLFAKAIDDKYGAGVAEELNNQRFTTHKFTVAELEAIIADAKQSTKEYLDNLK